MEDTKDGTTRGWTNKIAKKALQNAAKKEKKTKKAAAEKTEGGIIQLATKILQGASRGKGKLKRGLKKVGTTQEKETEVMGKERTRKEKEKEKAEEEVKIGMPRRKTGRTGRRNPTRRLPEGGARSSAGGSRAEIWQP